MADGLGHWGYVLLCTSLLWAFALPIAIAGAIQLSRLARRIEQDGLVAFLPGAAAKTLHEPLFDLLHSVYEVVSQIACNLIRLAMLVCLELDADQQREVLEGLDPRFRTAVFQSELVDLLPWPLRRLLLGRAADGAEAEAEGRAVTLVRSKTSSGLGAAGRQWESEDSPMRHQSAPEMPRAPSLTSLASTEINETVRYRLLEVVRGMEVGLSQDQRERRDTIIGTVFTFERILTQKAARTAVQSFTARSREMASTTVAIGKEKVDQLRAGARDLAADPKTRAVAVSAAGGAAALGATGGAAGFLSGGFVGAAAGILPAFFTFGLSIPIGAAVGAGTGLCVGSAVGGSAGLVCGGAAGHYRYKSPEDARELADWSVMAPQGH